MTDRDHFAIPAVPSELNRMIFGKMTLVSFTRMHRTCKAVNRLCSSTKFQFNALNINIQDSYLSFEGINPRIYDAKYLRNPEDVDTILGFRVTCLQLSIRGEPMNSTNLSMALNLAVGLNLQCAEFIYLVQGSEDYGEKLKDLLQLLKPSSVTITDVAGHHRVNQRPYFSKRFAPPTLFKNMRHVRLPFCDYGDQEMLQLQGPDIVLESDHLTAAGVTSPLKQWLRRERQILCVSLRTSVKAEDVVKGLPVRLMYTPSTHDTSVLKKLDIHRMSYDFDGVSWYELCRSPSEKLLIKIGKGRVFMKPVADADKNLLDALTSEEYRDVVGECRRCGRKDCGCYIFIY